MHYASDIKAPMNLNENLRYINFIIMKFYDYDYELNIHTSIIDNVCQVGFGCLIYFLIYFLNIMCNGKQIYDTSTLGAKSWTHVSW